MAKGLPYSVTVTMQGDLRVGIYSNGGDLLTKLDLSEINLRFQSVASPEMKAFFTEIANNSGVVNLNNNKDTSSWYALVPLSLNEEVAKDDFLFFRIQEAILLACPSLFRLLSVLVFQKRADQKSYDLTSHSPYSPNTSRSIGWENAEIDAKLFSEFLIFYVKNFRSKPFLHTPIKYYVNNFTYANREGMAMSYFNLCIALEGMLTSNNEITYRLSRFCAVINSDTHEIGEVIFRNAKKLYNLRSEIAHNGTFHDDVIDDYREYLVQVVSSTIVLLLQSDIGNVEDLDKMVTRNGYGEKTKLFPNIKFVFFEADKKFEIELPKYKRSI